MSLSIVCILTCLTGCGCLVRAHDFTVIMVPAHPHPVPLVLLLQPLLQGKEVFSHCVCAHIRLSCHHFHGLFPWFGFSHLQHLAKLGPSLLGSIEVTLMERLAGVPLHILPCPWNSWINNSTGAHLSIYRFLFILPAARHIAWWNWNWYMKAVKYLKYKNRK